MRSSLVICFVIVALAAAACGGGNAERAGRPSRRYISIATGGTGGVYYVYGGGLARVISQSLPGVEAAAESTGGSVDSLKLLEQGRADLAFTLTDTLDAALKGQSVFTGFGPVRARTIAVLYANYLHVVARADSSIGALADLRGRVVSTGAPGSGTELIALRVLEAAGLDPGADIRRQSLSAAESADALRDRKIDAFFWSGGLPTAAVLDLSSGAGPGIALLANDAVLPTLQQRFGPGLYHRLVIPRDAYPGMTADVPVVGVQNALVVHERMDEPLAYDLTRVLLEKRAELAAVHPEAGRLSTETAASGSPAPLHPGAERYYREVGAIK
jgi:TRAP transporter TAXI family solute receptor